MILKPMTDRRWRGYSFEELQEQILINDARIEVRKHKLAERVNEIRNTPEESGPVSGIMKAYRYFMTAKTFLRKIKSIIQRFRKR